MPIRELIASNIGSYLFEYERRCTRRRLTTSTRCSISMLASTTNLEIVHVASSETLESNYFLCYCMVEKKYI